MEASLLDQTFALLDQCPLPRQEIARGADVGPEWLKKLAAREIADPSVRRIQKLHDFLASVAIPAQTAPQVQAEER